MANKKQFEKVMVTVILFSESDVITASPVYDDDIGDFVFKIFQ